MADYVVFQCINVLAFSEICSADFGFNQIPHKRGRKIDTGCYGKLSQRQ